MRYLPLFRLKRSSSYWRYDSAPAKIPRLPVLVIDDGSEDLTAAQALLAVLLCAGCKTWARGALQEGVR